MQQVQEMLTNGIIISHQVSAAIMVRIVKPVKQHGSEACQKPVSQITRAFKGMIFCFR